MVKIESGGKVLVFRNGEGKELTAATEKKLPVKTQPSAQPVAKVRRLNPAQEAIAAAHRELFGVAGHVFT